MGGFLVAAYVIAFVSFVLLIYTFTLENETMEEYYLKVGCYITGFIAVILFVPFKLFEEIIREYNTSANELYVILAFMFAFSVADICMIFKLKSDVEKRKKYEEEKRRELVEKEKREQEEKLLVEEKAKQEAVFKEQEEKRLAEEKAKKEAKAKRKREAKLKKQEEKRQEEEKRLKEEKRQEEEKRKAEEKRLVEEKEKKKNDVKALNRENLTRESSLSVENNMLKVDLVPEEDNLKITAGDNGKKEKGSYRTITIQYKEPQSDDPYRDFVGDVLSDAEEPFWAFYASFSQFLVMQGILPYVMKTLESVISICDDDFRNVLNPEDINEYQTNCIDEGSFVALIVMEIDQLCNNRYAKEVTMTYQEQDNVVVKVVLSLDEDDITYSFEYDGDTYTEEFTVDEWLEDDDGDIYVKIIEENELTRSWY